MRKGTFGDICRTTRNGYKNQLIYYYNTGIGNISEITGAIITETLVGAIERRYKQLGGNMPIQQTDIDEYSKNKKGNK